MKNIQSIVCWPKNMVFFCCCNVRFRFCTSALNLTDTAAVSNVRWTRHYTTRHNTPGKNALVAFFCRREWNMEFDFHWKQRNCIPFFCTKKYLLVIFFLHTIKRWLSCLGTTAAQLCRFFYIRIGRGKNRACGIELRPPEIKTKQVHQSPRIVFKSIVYSKINCS